MKNGDATLRRWFCMCLFLLAVLPALMRAETVNFTVTGQHTGGVTASYSGMIDFTFTPPNHLQLNAAYKISSDPSSVGANYFVERSWDSMTSWSGGSASFVIPSGGTIKIRARTGDDQGGFGEAVFTKTYGGGTSTETLVVSLTVKNNLNRVQTLTVGNAPTQILAGGVTATKIFTVNAVAGASVSIGSTPDPLVFDMNYDPLEVPVGGGTASRSAHIGTAPETRRVHAVFINYYQANVSVIAKIDGVTVGSVLAHASEDGEVAKSTSYDWVLSMAPESVLNFEAPEGKTASVRTSFYANIRSIVVTLGAPVGSQVSSTTDPTSGETTTTTTGANGTTTIDRTRPGQPTNTNTNPNSVFGGNNTGSSGTGNSYGNTSAQANSAAAQDAANSLAGIAADMRRVRENSDADRADRESSLTNDGKAAVKGFLAQYSDPSSASAAAMAGTSANAGQGQANAAAAVASSLGAASMANLDTPTAPNPGTVSLNIGPGKTIEMNLNPFSASGPLGGIVGLAAAFIKRLIAWALVAAFLYEVMKEVRGVCGTAFLTGGYTSQTVDMIKSVNIFGWSVGVPAGGAVRVALVALAVTLVLTLPAAALAAVEGGLPWSSLREVFTQGAPGTGGGMLSNALGYVDYVLPWRLMLTLPLYYIIVHNVLFPLQIFWQMVFKFLP